MTVLQAGPLEESITADEFVGQDGWEAAEPLVYDGTERDVAVKSESDGLTFLFGFEASNGSYGVTVEATPGTAAPCPETYSGVCRRVLETIEPHE